jgi:UDP-N-acetylglucosamine 2-epimerase
LNLDVGSGAHGWQTGQMLMRLEEVMQQQQPDWVLVYGDTNSTLAGALAACKLHLPVAHVEAGLRSFNREMPEEHNRVLTDHCAELLLCPTETAVNNLSREGIAASSIHLVGDTMFDAVLEFAAIANQQSHVLSELELHPKSYFLATLHRPYNTDVPEKLATILRAFAKLNHKVVFPVHPRTRQKISELEDQNANGNLMMVDPVGYLDMLVLEQNAKVMLTDSGGMQKEAFFFGVPCVTLRPETEWVETVKAGWNIIVGSDPDRIIDAAQSKSWPSGSPPILFGDGSAGRRIVTVLEQGLE